MPMKDILLPEDLKSVEEIFNPNEFTEKELLKLVYRDLHRLQKDFEDYKKNNDYNAKYLELTDKVKEVQAQLHNQKEMKEDSDKKINRNMTIVATAVVVLDLLLKFLIK